mgnify:CR=1 FL=1
METASIYNCFLLKSQIAVSNPEMDMPMEINAGIRKSDTAAMPEIKSTIFRSQDKRIEAGKRFDNAK